jgi:DNA-binding transcriptional LysR family regulator
MDRLSAMRALVMTVDAGGFSAAARALGCSTATVSRAIDGLERQLQVILLRRTTRSVRLTAPGAQYLEVCRRVLAELAVAERAVQGELDVARGVLTVTAPLAFGALHVRPVVSAYLRAQPEVQVRLLLMDRLAHLIDEGIDAAVRIAAMPDSALVATRIGQVQRVLVASPRYLARHGTPRTPADLAAHRCIAFSPVTPTESWSFAGKRGARAVRVKVRPALTVNTAETAVAAARDGDGLVLVLSYQAGPELAAGRLVRLLAGHEPPPLPVHLVTTAAARTTARVRAFVDLAVPKLRAALG